MESHRRPAGRRTLLPAEVELCEAVGLSEEEYWYFVDVVDSYNGKRDPAYDLIPDVRNDPVTVAIVQIVVGLALTAAAALLAPKPKSPEVNEEKRLGQRTLGGAQESGNFAQTDGFQSVQDLARQGQTIPLVFAKKGVRVNGQLVWSQMIAEERAMQLKALFVFSDGVTEAPPDFESLAIGDTTLATYTAQKVRAYWNAFGGRITEDMTLLGSLLPAQPFTDTFSTYWDGSERPEPFFSGATFTPIQASFGAYAPMHSQTAFKPAPELVLIPREGDDNIRADAENRKKLRNNRKFSQRSYFTTVRNPSGGGGFGYSGLVNPGTPAGSYDQILYRITTGCEVRDDPEYEPEKLDFINSSTVSRRRASDQQIALGELYLVGDTTLGVCVQKAYTDSTRAWNPSPEQLQYAVTPANDLSVWFAVTTPGTVQCISSAGEEPATRNPLEMYEAFALQRAAVATVTNTIPCQATELILKSRVYKQISGFPDLQSWPSEKLINEYEENGGGLSLGSVTKYQKRLSFFLLEVRTLGETQWTDITGLNYFVVEGNFPVDQYNYIRVDTATKGNVESEFRLRPVAGVGAYRVSRAYFAPMRRLRYGVETKYSLNGYVVTYSGDYVALTDEYLTNPDFIRAADTTTTEGAIDNLNVTPTQAGTFPPIVTSNWQYAPVRYNLTGSWNFTLKRINIPLNYNRWEYWWDGRLRAGGNYSNVNTEPPQWVSENTGIGVPFPNVQYSWSLRTPGRENDTSTSGDYITVYRSIQRRDLITTTTPSEPYAAGVTDAQPAVDAAGNSLVSEGASGLKFYVRVWRDSAGNDVGYKWTVDANNQGKGYKPGDRVIVISPTDGREIWMVTITGTVTVDETVRELKNYQPYDALVDISAFDSQTQSNESSPEHEVVAINEKRAQFTPTYADMTTGGLRINSSTEWTNFSSFSAFMKKGIVVENLITGRAEASNLLPDIVFAMMTNEVWGAGKILGPQQVDRDAMTEASRFCEANGFTWDGVVNERINFRQWVYQQAQYCLLDATVIGGRFALKPSVPTYSTGRINNNGKPNILALFTDGNMVDMQVTWLLPEERQLFRAEVMWREDTINGFPKTRNFTLRFADAYGGSDSDPIETFDLSSFCTSETHALRFALFALGVRKHVDHSIAFKTTPQAAMGLVPGEYFKVSSASSHANRFDNGSINNEGFITSTNQLADGAYQVYYWRAGTEGVSEGTLIVANGRCADFSFYNTVFTFKSTTVESRVYKLEALTYAEDGLVEVAGSHMPLTDIGSLAILDWNPAYYVPNVF